MRRKKTTVAYVTYRSENTPLLPRMFNLASKYPALDLIERYGIVGAIVQTGGASGFVASLPPVRWPVPILEREAMPRAGSPLHSGRPLGTDLCRAAGAC
jgi:hypothetical protein